MPEHVVTAATKDLIKFKKNSVELLFLCAIWKIVNCILFERRHHKVALCLFPVWIYSVHCKLNAYELGGRSVRFLVIRHFSINT